MFFTLLPRPRPGPRHPAQVSVFVDGDRRATGKFVGRRLCSRSPSPAIRDLSSDQRPQDDALHGGGHGGGCCDRPDEEPLRLGSRGSQDHWQGRLCGVRVWGAASQVSEVRRRMAPLPAASLVRPPPQASFGITVPGTQEAFRRLRLHAPLPDVSGGGVADAAAACAPGGDSVAAHGQGRKAYYEVCSILKRVGRDQFPSAGNFTRVRFVLRFVSIMTTVRSNSGRVSRLQAYGTVHLTMQCCHPPTPRPPPPSLQVILRSGGCMQIGWGLPSSCPSSRNLGVGDDDYSWAVDGMRSMKWHGNTSPVSSPYAHGVPYGRDWNWNAGDAIGCAVDLDAGVMSFRWVKARLGEPKRAG